ncbi:serine hydrolase [Halomonas denitrificans]|nr:serine hydrolase [Halomonas denitrificans]
MTRSIATVISNGMRRPMAALFLLGLLTGPAWGQFPVPADVMYRAGFEGDSIAPAFPVVGGDYVLPPEPIGDRLQWLIDELAVGETTTLAEVQARFSPAFDPASIRDFINDVLRVEFPNGRIIDLISLTPVRATVVIDGDSGPATSGFLQFGVEYAGSNLITLLQVSNFGGTVQFPADQTLTLAQAADKFMTFHPENGLFVGYVDLAGRCQPIEVRDPDVARGLGSIFKTWVLGAVAADIADGIVDRSDPIPLVADERAAGGTINSEPLGTVFDVQDMGTLMMGISDNTATDHLHELTGRIRAGEIVQQYGIADPDELLPFLNISEQFHVFTRFDLPTAESYVDGTEAFQDNFLSTMIEPEGPSFPVSFPFFHESLLTSGTWRATASDICRTLAGLRSTPEDFGAFEFVDRAMGSQAAQPNIRAAWDRTWYKGGSLTSGVSGNHVLTHAWLLENEGDFPPFVIVALANNPAGGIDPFEIQSVTNRMAELLAGFQPWD